MLEQQLKKDLQNIIIHEMEPTTTSAIMIALLISRMAMRIQNKRLKDGTDKCYKYKGTSRKKCILTVKISAKKQQLNHLAKNMSKCNKSVNPHKCKEILNKKMTVIMKKISELEQQKKQL